MAEQNAEKTEEKFSFMPNSSRTPIQRYYHDKKPAKEPECYPSPTTPAYDPSKKTKISLSTEICAERCVRHVYGSGRDKIPTTYWPKSWMRMWGVDWINKENANDMIMMEMSADREVITIRRLRPPIEMSRPVDAELFQVDSDEFAEALEKEEEEQQQKTKKKAELV